MLAAALAAGLIGLGLMLARQGPGSLARTPLGQWLDWTGGDAGKIGDRAPNFVVMGLDGTPRTLPVPGQAVLVNYWASWCVPCRAELPLLSAFAAGQASNGIQVVGIALDDAGSARAFLAARLVGFPTASELPSPDDSSVKLGNTRGVLPYSVLIDAQGRIRARRIGPFTDAADLRDWLAAAGAAGR
ncbi:MAG: TlpA family protein disulfide reductase [Arenimonas sp.]